MSASRNEFDPKQQRRSDRKMATFYRYRDLNKHEEICKSDYGGGKGTFSLTAGAHDMLLLELKIMDGAANGCDHSSSRHR